MVVARKNTWEKVGETEPGRLDGRKLDSEEADSKMVNLGK